MLFLHIPPSSFSYLYLILDIYQTFFFIFLMLLFDIKKNLKNHILLKLSELRT